MPSDKQGGIKYHFWVFGKIRLGIELRSPRRWANILDKPICVWLSFYAPKESINPSVYLQLCLNRKADCFFKLVKEKENFELETALNPKFNTEFIFLFKIDLVLHPFSQSGIT